jgi:hypothetical protein
MKSKYGFLLTEYNGHICPWYQKRTQKALLSYAYQKKFVSPKINQNRVANNDFDLQNDFHEDRLSLSVYEENNSKNFVPLPLASRYHFWLALPIVHHRDTSVPYRPSPFKVRF